MVRKLGQQSVSVQEGCGSQAKLIHVPLVWGQTRSRANCQRKEVLGFDRNGQTICGQNGISICILAFLHFFFPRALNNWSASCASEFLIVPSNSLQVMWFEISCLQRLLSLHVKSSPKHGALCLTTQSYWQFLVLGQNNIDFVFVIFSLYPCHIFPSLNFSLLSLVSRTHIEASNLSGNGASSFLFVWRLPGWQSGQ